MTKTNEVLGIFIGFSPYIEYLAKIPRFQGHLGLFEKTFSGEFIVGKYSAYFEFR